MECEIPFQNAASDEIESILKKYKTIAVVGLSRDPEKDGHRVGLYLKEHNYKIIPVNPNAAEILGETAYPSLKDIPGDTKVDIVCIFRPSEKVSEFVDEAIAISAKVVWMQLGIVNNDAAEKARSAGLQVVMNKCMKIEHGLWLDR